jgi:DNA modification methylase
MAIQNEIIPLSRLLPDERNPRRHSAENIKRLASRILAVGFTSPVLVVAETGLLAAGHRRRLALEYIRSELRRAEPDGIEPGWGVPARVGSWSEIQALQVLTGDNGAPDELEYDETALAGLLAELERQGEITGAGYSPQQLEALIADLAGEQSGAGGGLLPDADPDALPEQAPTRCRPGDLWALGEHRLLCGDSTRPEDVARLLGDARPNLMVTDPPYGVEYDPNWRNEAAEKGLIAHAAVRVGEVANDDRADWREAWELFPGEVVYCWHADLRASSVWESLVASGFLIRAQIIWAKTRFAISQGHYHFQHEPCFYAVRKGATAGWIGDRSQTTLWTVTLDKNVDGGHSTQKPVECMARPLRNHGGDVYDPFLGSGTTIIAAEQNGRRCRGLEISPKYGDVILSRWETCTGRTAELLERVSEDR